MRDKPDTNTQIAFNRGNDIGVLAHKLFPGGINVAEQYSNKEAAVNFTNSLINQNTPVIYEATFLHEGVLVMVDLLVRTENGYEAYEVKSSLRISEIYLKDLCLQYYILTKSLKNLTDIFLVTINGDYVLNGELEIKKYFKRKSYKQLAESNLTYIESQINLSKELIEREQIPAIDIGKHCFSPYKCDFFETCWKGVIVEGSIFEIGKVGKEQWFEWKSKGINTILELDQLGNYPDDVRIQIESLKQNKEIINKERIKELLKRIKDKFIALDIEVWASAVPKIQNTKPYQKLPFLFSIYDGNYAFNYFFDYKEDDRKEFAQKLISVTKEYPTIVVYDRNLEVAVIDELIIEFKGLKSELKEVKQKFVDIASIIQSNAYYHHSLKGNYSLKALASSALDANPFKELNIQSGLEAMSYFSAYQAEENEIERQFIKGSLEMYCQADVKATYYLTRKFQEIAKAE